MPTPHRFYYLQNFLFALHWLGERYDDVLNEAEHRFLSRFQQLPHLAQALLVRLLMRRGPWFLEGKLVYEEIPDVRAAAAPLLELGFLDAQHPMGLDALFALHTKAELMHLLPCASIYGSMHKSQMLEVLRSEYGHERAYLVWNPWLETRRAKLLMRIGQACERIQRWELAELAYDETQYLGARHRQIRVYECTGRFVDALALAQKAHAAPESEEESQRLSRMLPRLRRRVGEGVASRKVRAPAAPTSLTVAALERPSVTTPVEIVLRDHLTSDRTPVFYVENALINSLFGLLCWPAIFAPLPGAFFHPFQSGPADLAAPDFVQRRKADFDACLALLADGSYHSVIRQRFLDKHGVQSPFVFWGALTQSLLDLALACIPAEHLRLLFCRMLAAIKENRTGFPDLVKFWPAEHRYELIEVKGPGDKLQDNQIRWLQYFGEHGIPASVCHVRWRETLEVQQPKSRDALMVEA